MVVALVLAEVGMVIFGCFADPTCHICLSHTPSIRLGTKLFRAKTDIAQ